MVYLLKMVIFHSYVKEPHGNHDIICLSVVDL
jgi:hypothetical protein